VSFSLGDLLKLDYILPALNCVPFVDCFPISEGCKDVRALGDSWPKCLPPLPSQANYRMFTLSSPPFVLLSPPETPQSGVHASSIMPSPQQQAWGVLAPLFVPFPTPTPMPMPPPLWPKHSVTRQTRTDNVEFHEIH